MPDLAHIAVAFLCLLLASGFAYCIIPPRIPEPEEVSPEPLEIYWPSGTVGQRPYDYEHRRGIPSGVI